MSLKKTLKLLFLVFLMGAMELSSIVILETPQAHAEDDEDTSETKRVWWPFFWGKPPGGQSEKVIRRRRRSTTSGPMEAGVRPARLTGRESCRTIMSHSQRQAPIYNAFMKYFKQCAGENCRPNKVYGMWGCRASGRSCHHTGEAVDIGGYKCGGRQVNMVLRATRGSVKTNPEFDRFVQCMISKGGFRKLYKCKDHWDHAHFSYGCAQRRI